MRLPALATAATRLPEMGLPGAIIFDLDGLMLDTEWIGLRTWDLAGADLGCEVPHAIRTAMIGRNLRAIGQILHERMPPGSPVEALLERANHYYHALLDHEPPRHKDGLLPLLEHVRDAGIPRAVATSSQSTQATKKLADAGIGHFFEHRVCGDQVAHSKPDPEIFLAAASRLRVPPVACLVLEDSGPGIQAAHAAGMRSFLVPDVHAPEPAVAALADGVFSSLHGVLAWIKGPASLPSGQRPRM
jgi:HAD superfamily hydrolase (TIGR01509 family)